MVMIKRLGHAVEMSCCCEDDKKVEDLMRVAPDVECARVTPLWPANLWTCVRKHKDCCCLLGEGTNCVEKCAEYVHEAMQNDPAEAHPILEGLVAKLEQPVAYWDDARKTETDKHESAVGPPSGRPKPFNPGDDDTSNTKKTYLPNSR